MEPWTVSGEKSADKKKAPTGAFLVLTALYFLILAAISSRYIALSKRFSCFGKFVIFATNRWDKLAVVDHRPVEVATKFLKKILIAVPAECRPGKEIQEFQTPVFAALYYDKKQFID